MTPPQIVIDTGIDLCAALREWETACESVRDQIAAYSLGETDVRTLMVAFERLGDAEAVTRRAGWIYHRAVRATDLLRSLEEGDAE